MDMTDLEVDETPSRLDKIGTAFMNNPESITNEEAFELLCDLIPVTHLEMAEHMNGRVFETVTQVEAAEERE